MEISKTILNITDRVVFHSYRPTYGQSHRYKKVQSSREVCKMSLESYQLNRIRPLHIWIWNDFGETPLKTVYITLSFLKIRYIYFCIESLRRCTRNYQYFWKKR